MKEYLQRIYNGEKSCKMQIFNEERIIGIEVILKDIIEKNIFQYID